MIPIRIDHPPLFSAISYRDIQHPQYRFYLNFPRLTTFVSFSTPFFRRASLEPAQGINLAT